MVGVDDEYTTSSEGILSSDANLTAKKSDTRVSLYFERRDTYRVTLLLVCNIASVVNLDESMPSSGVDAVEAGTIGSAHVENIT